MTVIFDDDPALRCFLERGAGAWTGGGAPGGGSTTTLYIGHSSKGAGYIHINHKRTRDTPDAKYAQKYAHSHPRFRVFTVPKSTYRPHRHLTSESLLTVHGPRSRGATLAQLNERQRYARRARACEVGFEGTALARTRPVSFCARSSPPLAHHANQGRAACARTSRGCASLVRRGSCRR